MRRLIFAVALATGALSGCAQLKDWYRDANANAEAGSTARNDDYYVP